MSRGYPEPNPRELRQIDSDIEKPAFTDAQQRMSQSLLHFNPLPTMPDLDEFSCPCHHELDPRGWYTTNFCEGKAQGLGCEDLTTCKPYLAQKRLQTAHPELNWEDIRDNDKSKLGVINLIKKGAIINP